MWNVLRETADNCWVCVTVRIPGTVYTWPVNVDLSEIMPVFETLYGFKLLPADWEERLQTYVQANCPRGRVSDVRAAAPPS